MSTIQPPSRRAPSGLGRRGKTYWQGILKAYELSDSEL
jgi:hypothetical protein